MDGLLREFEKLEKKQINKPLISSVDRIISLLEETKRKIENGTPYCNHSGSNSLLDQANTAPHVALLRAKYSGETSKILDAQKESHKAIASCTKALQTVRVLSG